MFHEKVLHIPDKFRGAFFDARLDCNWVAEIRVINQYIFNDGIISLDLRHQAVFIPAAGLDQLPVFFLDFLVAGWQPNFKSKGFVDKHDSDLQPLFLKDSSVKGKQVISMYPW